MSSVAVFSTRLTDALNNSGLTTNEWSTANAIRLIGIFSDTIIDSIANGEEISLGKLGKFVHHVSDERTFSNNLQGGKKTRVPRRIKVRFEPSIHMKKRLEGLEQLMIELGHEE